MLKLISKKVVFTLFLILICIFSATSITEKAVDGFLFKSLSQNTNQYINETMTRAGLSYATLRMGNGIVSTIQGSQVEVGIVGNGVSIAAGEILDPINDILEKTSSVMTVSLASLGIQKIIIKVSSWLSMTIILSFATFLLIVGMWTPDTFMNGKTKLFAIKLLAIALLIYFFVPFAYYSNGKIYDLFMSQTYESSVTKVKKFNEDLEQIQEKKETVEENFWDKLDIKAKLNALKQKFIDIQDKTEHLVTNLINLMIVFLVQTVLLPILFLWLLIKLIGAILENNELDKIFSGGPLHMLSKWGGTTQKKLA